MVEVEAAQAELGQVQRTWETLGRLDPMWAILSDPAKFGQRWTEAEFFDSGSREIHAVLEKIKRLLPGSDMERALDFGCGIGRLSRALSTSYARVDGVDIAPSMIALARQRNAFPERCFFALNAAPDLRLYEDAAFDMIYSNIVLQHMPAPLARGYMVEFARCAKPGAAIVFQIPHARRLNKSSLKQVVVDALYSILPASLVAAYRLRRHPSLPRDLVANMPKKTMEMHAMKRSAVIAAMENAGCRVVDVEDTSVERDPFVNLTYVFQKLPN